MFLPSSKSLTNRDFILSALSKWTSTLSGILESEDTHHMIEALRALWFQVEVEWDTATIHWWIFHMKGKNQEIYLGNSWTSMRFLSWLAILNTVWSITFTGNKYMQQRPIRDLVDAMEQMWIPVSCQTGCPPITITPTKKHLKTEVTIKWTSSSQYLTALLQIAPCLLKWLTIIVEGDLVSKPYIDLTIHEMNKFWVSVVNDDYRTFSISPQTYQAQALTLEWDASALSYPVAHTLLHGWNMTINNLWSSTKQGDYWFLNVCEIFWLKHKSDTKTTTILALGIDAVDLSEFKDVTVDFEQMPDVSLTYMILAPFLPGTTTLTWLQTLNLKECKRIEAMRENLQALDIPVSATNDSISIGEIALDNLRSRWWEKRIPINSYDDHRIAMSFGVLDTYLWWLLDISTPECVAKTYPTFWEDLERRFM